MTFEVVATAERSIVLGAPVVRLSARTSERAVAGETLHTPAEALEAADGLRRVASFLDAVACDMSALTSGDRHPVEYAIKRAFERAARSNDG